MTEIVKLCYKNTFEHWHQAVKYANNMRKRNKDKRSKALKPYNCPLCNKIHLTSEQQFSRSYKKPKRI